MTTNNEPKDNTMTTPMTPVESVNAAIARMTDGEALPSIRDSEFIDLVNACTSLAGTDPDTPAHQAAYQAIGMRAVFLVLSRLSASMLAERQMILLRDTGKPLC